MSNTKVTNTWTRIKNNSIKWIKVNDQNCSVAIELNVRFYLRIFTYFPMFYLKRENFSLFNF